MERFQHGDVAIAYLDQGAGEPIVLIHGFASSARVNWIEPGWVATLTEAGRRVIAFDNRGHGQSTKLYQPEDYRSTLMAEDAVALMEHLGIERADVMGYSMGARIAAYVAFARPARVRSLILGGLGVRLVDGIGLPVRIADALEAPSLEQLTNPTERMFRAFAERTGSDLKALAACMRGSRQTASREQVAALAMPVLIAVGTRDDIAGSAQELAALIPRARALDIPGRDHNLAVADKVFKQAVLDLLKERP